MNMFRTFMELDALHEAKTLNEATRPELISKLRAAGKNYNFNKFTDAQLYKMCQKLDTPKKKATEPKHDLDLDFEPVEGFDCCDFCGMRLTDMGQCPVCDLGEEDLNEDLIYCWCGEYFDKDGNKHMIYATKSTTSYDADEAAEKLEELIPEPYTKFVFRGTIVNNIAEKHGWTLVEWKTSSGDKVTTNASSNTSVATTPATSQQATASQVSSGKYTVRIVTHGGRLRALGTDGVHPAAWVAFPNNLRQRDGQLYEVDQLIWNGKNYRVAGNIVEI